MTTEGNPRRWRLLDSRTIVDDRWLRLDAERVELPDGTVLDPFYVIGEADWAALVPRLPDGRVLLVEQYRRGADAVTLELPAGDVDPGETAAEAVARECREETGHRVVGDPRPLLVLHPDPTRNRCRGSGFAARVEPLPGEETEAGIRLRALTPTECRDAIDGGRIVHAAHVAFLLAAL